MSYLVEPEPTRGLEPPNLATGLDQGDLDAELGDFLEQGVAEGFQDPLDAW
ncbi:MAG: hypothetical protein ACRDS0_05945 [Pseudonocardiaceae bacterium]